MENEEWLSLWKQAGKKPVGIVSSSGLVARLVQIDNDRPIIGSYSEKGNFHLLCDNEHRWKICQPSIIINGLEWQPKSSEYRMRHDDAVGHVKSLGCGWRLPSIKELMSIVDYQKYDLAIVNKLNYLVGFKHWSSSININNISRWWTVDLTNGEVATNDMREKNFVVCVRDVIENKVT